MDTAAALTFWWRTKVGIPLDRPAYIGDGRYGGLGPEAEQRARAARSFAEVPPAEQDRWFQLNRDRLARCAAPALPTP